MSDLYRCPKCEKLSDKWTLINTKYHCPSCGGKISKERDIVKK